MSPLPRELFSAGECPVCADSGALLCLLAIPSRTLFFFCPICGVAWKTPPPPDVLDELLTLEAFAPDGVEIPKERDIWTETSPFRSFKPPLKRIPAAPWLEYLKPYLSRREGGY
jgi:hypothetical protein